MVRASSPRYVEDRLQRRSFCHARSAETPEPEGRLTIATGASPWTRPVRRAEPPQGANAPRDGRDRPDDTYWCHPICHFPSTQTARNRPLRGLCLAFRSLPQACGRGCYQTPAARAFLPAAFIRKQKTLPSAPRLCRASAGRLKNSWAIAPAEPEAGGKAWWKKLSAGTTSQRTAATPPFRFAASGVWPVRRRFRPPA